MKRELEPFYRSLRQRGLNQERLAALAVDDFGHGMNRSVLARVLRCRPGRPGSEGKERGKRSRQRLFPHLTGRELELLGWTDEYLAWRERKSQSLLTSAATEIKGVEHSSM